MGADHGPCRDLLRSPGRLRAPAAPTASLPSAHGGGRRQTAVPPAAHGEHTDMRFATAAALASDRVLRMKVSCNLTFPVPATAARTQLARQKCTLKRGTEARGPHRARREAVAGRACDGYTDRRRSGRSDSTETNRGPFPVD